MRDKYDQDIETLLKHPKRLVDHWLDASPLFQFCNKSGRPNSGGGFYCGCPTMIRQRCAVAANKDLTQRIFADERIPNNWRALSDAFKAAGNAGRRALLQVFAEWQRIMDQEIRGAECKS